MRKVLFTIVSVTVLLAACKSSKESASAPTPKPIDCSGQTLTYATDIKPIIETNCTRCHNTNEKAGFNFFKLESVKKSASEGSLLGTIKHLSGYPEMPARAAQLDQASINKIECWINNGMKE